MFELKSDHIHPIEQYPHQQNQLQQIEIQPFIKKKIRKVRIKTLPSNDPNQHYYADALIPELQISMEQISNSVFDAISFARKKIQFQVYTSVAEDQQNYLKRIFIADEQSRAEIRPLIEQISQNVHDLIVDQILSGDYDIKKVPKPSKDDIFGKNTTEAVIKIREKMLKNKISEFKADLSSSQTNQPSVDIYNPSLSDMYSAKSERTKKAVEFVNKMQKQQEQTRMHYKRLDQSQKYKRKQLQQQKQQIQLRLRQQRHQFLKHQYQEKRKSKQKQRIQSEKKKQQFQKYYKQNKRNKPMFKKKQEEFFQKYVLPQNKKKLQILKEIREEHKPISHDQLKEHEMQYLSIRDDHMYQKSAQRAMEDKTRKQLKKIYKSKFHSSIEKQERQRLENEEDPLQQKTKNYQRRWEYATQIKKKLRPKISDRMRQQSRRRSEQTKKTLNPKLRASDAYKVDGKQNLDQVHKYIAQLRAKGQIRYSSASNTLENSPKPKYKNYLKELGVTKSQLRHSVNYSTLAEKDPDRLKFDIKKKQEESVRREQYLTHLGSYNMENFMSEKKKLDEDYLDSVKAKMAILNKYS